MQAGEPPAYILWVYEGKKKTLQTFSRFISENVFYSLDC